MLKFLGVLFICLVVTSLSVLIAHLLHSNYLIQFAQNQSLQIMATALALNVATITFIMGSFLNIENRTGKENFNATRDEIKQNIIAMAVVFVINFFIVTAAGGSDELISQTAKDLLINVSTFLIVFFGSLVVEISLLVIKIRNP